MQLSELAGTRSFPTPGFEEPSVLRELHDPGVGIPAMSIGDENVAVGSDHNGGGAIEGILAIAGDSSLAQRQQNLPIGAEFENLVPLAVFSFCVSGPHVPVLVHGETVRKHKHSCAKAVHEFTRRIELENGRHRRAGTRVSTTS